jgi:hypothetical protein
VGQVVLSDFDGSKQEDSAEFLGALSARRAERRRHYPWAGNSNHNRNTERIRPTVHIRIIQGLPAFKTFQTCKTTKRVLWSRKPSLDTCFGLIDHAFVGGQWFYLGDDADIAPPPHNTAVSKNAYILFGTRRGPPHPQRDIRKIEFTDKDSADEAFLAVIKLCRAF